MMKRQRGFTLLEVLVATAVLAIAMSALIQSGQSSARVIQHLREQTVVAWVAANAVAQVQLEEGFAELGPRSGSDTMGRRTWVWRGQVVETPDPDLRRFDVAVFVEDSAVEPVFTLASFVGRY